MRAQSDAGKLTETQAQSQVKILEQIAAGEIGPNAAWFGLLRWGCFPATILARYVPSVSVAPLACFTTCRWFIKGNCWF